LHACEKKAKPTAWLDAAKAIMTTDTFPKVATRTATIGGVEVTINGIAKGAGMIQPDMATMLCFVFTDAPIAAPVLQTLVADSAARTVKCVPTDGNTSPSDSLLVFATGEAAKRGCPRIDDATDPRLANFAAAPHHPLRGDGSLLANDALLHP